MSVKTSVSIKGFDELRKELEELGGNFTKAIKSGARKGGNKVSQEANAEAKKNIEGKRHFGCNKNWSVGKRKRNSAKKK